MMDFERRKARQQKEAMALLAVVRQYIQESTHHQPVHALFAAGLGVVLAKRSVWQNTPERKIWFWVGAYIPYLRPLKRFRLIRAPLGLLELLARIESIDMDIAGRDCVAVLIHEDLARHVFRPIYNADVAAAEPVDFTGWESEEGPWQTTAEAIEALRLA